MYTLRPHDDVGINTFMGICNVMDYIITTLIIFTENMATLKQVKCFLKSHMIKLILLSGSFHMKFINYAEGPSNKFHMT